jgi:hypothetical protein
MFDSPVLECCVVNGFSLILTLIFYIFFCDLQVQAKCDDYRRPSPGQQL